MVGIQRGQLGTVMSPSGIGKSYFLVHLGKAAAMQGATVLHYTLEMTKEEIENRYDQMIVGLDRRRLVEQVGALSKLQRNVERIADRGGRVYVRYKPYGCTMESLRTDIENDMDQLEIKWPCLVLIDYGEVLAVSKRSRHEDLRAVWQELKSVAAEFNLAVWVATQANRGAIGAARVTDLDVAESYDKVRISDIFIGFNRNMIYDRKRHEWKEIDVENNANTIRLFVIKHRDHEDKYSVRFQCDFSRGQFYVRDPREGLLPSRVALDD